MAERTLVQELEMTQSWVKEMNNKIADLDSANLGVRKREIRALYLECKALTGKIEERLNIIGVEKPKAVDPQAAVIDPLPLPEVKWVEWGTVGQDTKEIVYHDSERDAEEYIAQNPALRKVKATFEIV